MCRDRKKQWKREQSREMTEQTEMKIKKTKWAEESGQPRAKLKDVLFSQFICLCYIFQFHIPLHACLFL